MQFIEADTTFHIEQATLMATILCIDDNCSVLEIYKALLESEGYRVLTARMVPPELLWLAPMSLTRSFSTSTCRE